jgi:hypothetical protein
MLLWLGEASGINRTAIGKAKNAALRAKPHFASQCAAIRQILPWSTVEAELNRHPV